MPRHAASEDKSTHHRDAGVVAPASKPGSAGCCGGHAHAPAPTGQDDQLGHCAGGCACHGHAGGSDTPAVHVLSREAARELDRLAIEEFGLPSLVLMENAARGVAGAVLEAMSGMEDARGHGVVIVCGPGNNGGDGMAVARHLHNAGLPVALMLVQESDDLPPDARVNARVVERMRLPVHRVRTAGDVRTAFSAAFADVGEPAVVIDALFGTGITRAPVGPGAAAIETMNQLGREGALVVAVDIPSGMDADTGLPVPQPDGTPGACVHADMTVALAGLKQGFLATPAAEFLGELLVVDIGVPFELIERLGVPMVFDR